MTKELLWNRQVADEFEEKALLSEREVLILETRLQGLTISEQAELLGVSASTVNRIIKRLKQKYDSIQPLSPTLPKRKKSAKEVFQEE